MYALLQLKHCLGNLTRRGNFTISLKKVVYQN